MADGWYLGKRKPGGVGRVFDGHVIAQALVAAQIDWPMFRRQCAHNLTRQSQSSHEGTRNTVPPVFEHRVSAGQSRAISKNYKKRGTTVAYPRSLSSLRNGNFGWV